MLVKTNNNIQGVIAANDNIAGAVIADLKAKGLKPIPLSGQDATAAGHAVHPRRLADGHGLQVRPGRGERRGGGRGRPGQGQDAEDQHDRLNGKIKEPTLALPVVWITKANYKRLFTDKFLKKSDVCVGDTRSTASTSASNRWRRLSGASTVASRSPDERNHATSPAPRHHQVLRVGPGADRRRLRGAATAR